MRGDSELTTFPVFNLALRGLRRYHGHQVHGLEHVPAGAAIIAFNHSLATYDGLMAGSAIYDATGRLPRPLFDRLFFRFPAVGRLVEGGGAVEGTRDNALSVLQQGMLIAVAPGGMREGLLLTRKRYEIDWRGRYGFVWLSLLSGAPIVLAACPRSDDLYDTYANPLTSLAYAKLKVPIPIARGWGPTAIPRPIRLSHLFSEPIAPPVSPDRADEAAVLAHHARVSRDMQQLMKDALALDS